VRSRRYPEADAPRYGVVRVQCFQFATEQMCGEAKTARVLVENCYQVIRNDILIRVLKDRIIELDNREKSSFHFVNGTLAIIFISHKLFSVIINC